MTGTRTQTKGVDAEVQGGNTKESRHLSDLGVLAVIGLAVLLLSHLLGLWPLLVQAAARNRWGLGEAFIVLAALSVPLSVFLLLRIRDLLRRTQERKSLEDKLLQKTHELESIFRALPDLYFRLDSDGTILDYQAGRLSDLHVEPRALLGRRIEDVLPAGVSGQFHEAIIQVHKTKAAVVLEYSLTDRGAPQTFEVRFLPFERKQIVAIFRDITERTLADQRLQQYAEELADSNEEIKMFAYIVSHDLRSPLVNIKGFAGELGLSVEEIGDLLEPHVGSLGEEAQAKLLALLKREIPEALSFIGSSVKRMDNLTNAILKLSRLGRRDLRLGRVETKTIVESVVKSLGHQIGTGGVTVSVGSLPAVTADATAMEQIFGNLVDNAIKYLEPGRPGMIQISGEERPGEAIFRVKDNGRGISAEDAERVFEIFRRVGRQDVPGEGMGLAYVRTLVRRHGGRIWCEPGQPAGTVFVFTIPAAGKHPSARAEGIAADTSDSPDVEDGGSETVRAVAVASPAAGK